MTIYIVTNGCYFEYCIEAVFHCQDQAEAYRSHFNYDRVETYEPGPDMTRAIQNDLWQCSVNYDTDNVQCRRETNTSEPKPWWEDNYGKLIHCRFWAQDKEHALRIANERYHSLKDGNEFVTAKKYEYRGSILRGRPSIKATHRADITITKQMINGELVEILRDEDIEPVLAGFHDISEKK